MSSRKRSRLGEDDLDMPSFPPRMNLYEQESTNMLTATFELPGLKPGDVTINFLHNKLSISGESVDPRLQGEETGMYTSRELRYGKFSRVLTVSLGTRPEDFKARMEDGLLTVTFPRNPPKQIPHRISIEYMTKSYQGEPSVKSDKT